MILDPTIRQTPTVLLKAPAPDPPEDRGNQRRIHQASDSYARNAADAGIIEAEYVDHYSRPAAVTPLAQAFLAPAELSAPAEGENPRAGVVYRPAPEEVPRPGRLINVFA